MKTTTTGAAVTVGTKLHFRGDFSNDAADYTVDMTDERAGMVHITGTGSFKGQWIPAGLAFTPRWCIVA